MTPAVSIALPPSREIGAYARAAERAGCRRVWLYDSPSVYGDVWIAVALAVAATDTIGVGTGVAVPSLRHPLVMASAIAAIEDLAPDRLVVALGTGFTARRAMGQKPMTWKALASYVTTLRTLLAGDVVEIDGAAAQMLHLPGWGPSRPIRTPIWTAPVGPKGFAASQELGVPGVLVTGLPSEGDPVFAERGLLMNGTVLEGGEDHTCARVVEAAGPWFASMYHGTWEFNRSLLEHLPGGTAWEAEIDRLRPANERHLAVHEGHISMLTDRDRVAIEVAGEALLSSGWTGSAEAIRARAEEAASAGITELVYAPAGPAIESEIESFAAAVLG